jgi:hypothetical protein
MRDMPRARYWIGQAARANPSLASRVGVWLVTAKSFLPAQVLERGRLLRQRLPRSRVVTFRGS